MGLGDLSVASKLFGRADEDIPIQDEVQTPVERKMSDAGSSASSVSASPESESAASSSGSSVTTVQSRPLRSSLPSSWYTSENFFALEARAIFSQVHPSDELMTDLAGLALCHPHYSVSNARHILQVQCRHVPNLLDPFQG